MLVCLFVMERHPRVGHIVHQVVPVPCGHRGRLTDRRHCSISAKLRSRRRGSKRYSPMCAYRPALAVSSQRKRSPLLLPRASKGPVLKGDTFGRPLLFIPEGPFRVFFLLSRYKNAERAQQLFRCGPSVCLCR